MRRAPRRIQAQCCHGREEDYGVGVGVGWLGGLDVGSWEGHDSGC